MAGYKLPEFVRVIIGLKTMAGLLKVSIPTLYLYLKEDMPGAKIGGQWHFHSLAVDRWFYDRLSNPVDERSIDEREFGVKNGLSS